MEPLRTCIGCRAKAPRSTLVRYVARDHHAVEDRAKSAPGRGAWVHDADACRAAAWKKSAFSRALRTRISPGQ